MSFWRISCVPCVIFCSSYDPLKGDFIAFKMNVISVKSVLLTWSLPVRLYVHANMLLHDWSYDFYDTKLSTE